MEDNGCHVVQLGVQVLSNQIATVRDSQYLHLNCSKLIKQEIRRLTDHRNVHGANGHGRLKNNIDCSRRTICVKAE